MGGVGGVWYSYVPCMLLVAIGQTHWELIIGLAQCDGGTGTCFNGPYGSCTVHSPSPDYPDAGSLASMNIGQNPSHGKRYPLVPPPLPKQNSLCSTILVGIKKCGFWAERMRRAADWSTWLSQWTNEESGERVRPSSSHRLFP